MSEIKNNEISNPNVNYTCFCSKFFYTNEKILYVLPCCHMIHETCFNKHLVNEYKKNHSDNKNSDKIVYCPFCKNQISIVLNEKKINVRPKYNQYKYDIMSVKLDSTAKINYLNLPLSIVKLTSLLNKIMLLNTEKEIYSTLEYIFRAFNIKVNLIDNTTNNPITYTNGCVKWKNKIDNDQKIVIISNHCNHLLDPIIMLYLFKCGFIASNFINTFDIGKLVASKVNLLVFKRGVDTNMVDKIKEYLEEKRKIVIFPEGSISNQKTLMQFRTGAFYTGGTICPVIINYEPMVYDDDMKQMIFKIITQQLITVNVTINDFFYPPFDNKKIEDVRDYMADVGELKKSRVSNKSIKD